MHGHHTLFVLVVVLVILGIIVLALWILNWLIARSRARL